MTFLEAGCQHHGICFICGLLEGVQKISIRKIFCIILSRIIFLIYLVKIFEVPVSLSKIADGMSDIYFGYEKQFCFFLLFWHSCQVFPWDSTQRYYCNTVTKCPRLRTFQVGSLTWATSEQFQNSRLCNLGDMLSNTRALPWEPNNLSSSPVHKFPHSEHVPNPTASTMLVP